MKTINLRIDLHIHTVASGHAFSTLNEIILCSEKKGIRTIGISDHGPSMLGAPVESYFSMKKDVNMSSNKIEVLFGCEANILNCAGEIDVSSSTVQGLDYVFAGLHHLTPYYSDGKLDNTRAIVNCITKNNVRGISHPISDSFPVEIIPIVEAARSNNTLLEINSRELGRCSRETVNQYLKMIELCSDMKVPIILGSDSHTLNTVGVFSAPQEIFEMISNTDVIVINNLPYYL